jgi:glycosyltransferase involved in cell wall biosynthesis
MLKVLCVVDKENTALDRLAKGVARYHKNIEYTVLAVHPKRPDAHQLADFEAEALEADIIDWQYFRTAEMLRARYSWLASKKQILTHNNPYSIYEQDWNGYDAVVANNSEINKNLSAITSAPLYEIPLTVDADFWTYNLDWKANRNIIMVANRIESKKGILPVAKACAKLNLHLILVGAISDTGYFSEVMATNVVEFHEQISDQQLKDLYYKSTVHICNSVDGFESGTLPVLEAMLCGVPVLSRNVGHIPDLNNKENMQILSCESEDVDTITNELQQMIFDKKRLESIRDAAWQSAKVRNFERRAYLYQKLYREVLYPGQVSVSVIMPVYDKPDIVRRTLDAVASQTYKNIEIVVADDNPEQSTAETIVDFAKYVNFPIRYLATSYGNEYGLARARNEAAIEATGEILVFCDQRILMDTDAIEQFVANSKRSCWLYGSKGAKKDFIENFSAIFRREFFRCGMFCERINEYGGLSQETRQRVREQGIQIQYLESAKALAIGKSSNRNRKRQEIIHMKNRLAKMYEL